MEQVFHTLEPEFKGKIAFINVDVNSQSEQQICYQYQIKMIPTTILMDNKGQITFNNIGVIKLEEMRAKLKNLINEG